MTARPIETARLTLAPQTLEQVRRMIAELSPEQRAEVSAEWLAQLDTDNVDEWTLGFAILNRETGVNVGQCAFKGPPDADGMVEIAYGVDPDWQGRGYAT